MLKTALIAGVAFASLSAGAAVAGPYANVEANSSFEGSDYQGTVTETHIGYEDALGEDATWYIQAGPAFISEDGEDLETEFSGKVGVSAEASENVDIYAEVSFITDDQTDVNYGTKVGVTYFF